MSPSRSGEVGTLSDRSTVSAIILAGGMGTRMGGRPKALLKADDDTLLERAVAQAGAHAAEVIVGVPAEILAEGTRIVGGEAIVVLGGETRQDTFRNTLAVAGGEIIIIHDVARPFASDDLWDAVIAGARAYGGAAPAVPIPARDSLAMREGQWLGAPVDRDLIVSIQTPYAFRRSILDRAMAEAGPGEIETSITTLVTRIGERVLLVPGEQGNDKVTFDEDWLQAERRLVQEAQARATRSKTREL